MTRAQGSARNKETDVGQTRKGSSLLKRWHRVIHVLHFRMWSAHLADSHCASIPILPRQVALYYHRPVGGTSFANLKIISEVGRRLD